MSVNDLRWFRDRLVLQEAGLLTEEEESRFEALMKDSAACRKLFEDFRTAAPTAPEPPEHISSYKLARWEQVRTTLRGFERRRVREHLEQCPVCREDLRLLGFEPGLERNEDLEKGESPAGTANPPPRPVSRSGSRDLSWWRTGGGWVVAVAACLSWLVVSTRSTHDSASVMRNPAVTSLGTTVRGTDLLAGGDVPSVMMSSDGRQIAVHLGATLAYSPEEPVRIRLLEASGREISSTVLPFGEVCSPHLLVLTSPQPLSPGRHLLQIAPTEPDSGRPALELPFDLVSRP